jgi:hypothetical protein
MDIPELQDPGLFPLDDSLPPLPTDGKEKVDSLSPGAEVPLQRSDPTHDESPPMNSEMSTIEAHHVVSPRDLSGQGSSIQVPAAPDGWTTIMSQDFEGAFPAGRWYVFDYDGSVNGEYFWDVDNYRPHTGSWSAWPAKGGADSVIPPTNYPNNMNSRMSYGFIDLTDAVDAELQFYYWLQSEQDYDFFGWYASIYGSSDHYGYRTSGNSSGWVAQNFDLTAVPVLGDVTGHYVFITFIFTSDASISFEGVYVDDILLRKDIRDSNLVPHTPSGWDQPLVPASVAGTHTVNDLYTYQNTYIDWTVKNLGPDDILEQFDTCLYIDNIELYCWYTNGKIAGNIAYVEDWLLNMTPTPGWHNLEIVTDVNNDVNETNELDNAWSTDFYWHPDANLSPYKQGSWDYPIVPASLTGTHTVSDLYTYQNTYIDWTIKNWGPEDILAQFDTCLYIDDVEINCWDTNGMIAGNIAYVEDWVLNMTPTPGWHNLKIVTDVYDVVLETNEQDNTWSMDFYWHPDANLAPYKPDSWFAPIVPSTLTGTNIVNDLYANMDTFIDWAVNNTGPEDILAQFQTCLYFDSVEIFCWYTNGKMAGDIAFIEDWALNLIPAPGWHTLEIVTDVYDVVLETNELDNTWAAEFYWNPSPNADIYVSPPSLTSQQAQDQEKTLKLEIYNYGSAPLDWSIYESSTGSCSAADIPWVSVSPVSGTTAQASITTIDVIFDSTGLATGTYQGILCISSNDPDESLIAMLIELETIDELIIFLPLLMKP